MSRDKGTYRENLVAEQVVSTGFSETVTTVTAVLLLKNGREVIASVETKAINDNNRTRLQGKAKNLAVDELAERDMHHKAEEKLSDDESTTNARVKLNKEFETIAGRRVKIVKNIKNDTDFSISDKYFFIGVFFDTFETARFNFKGEYEHGETIKAMRLKRIDGVNYD